MAKAILFARLLAKFFKDSFRDANLERFQLDFLGACTLTILGRKATSSRKGMRWPHVYVIRNWINTCLEKDAPEGSA